jgi:hypothetical protein
LIPHLVEKQSAKEMFKALVEIILRNKLRSIQMSRFDNVTSYLMKIT